MTLHEKIKQKAHEIYQERKRAGLVGSAFGDWLMAERAILKENKEDWQSGRCEE